HLCSLHSEYPAQVFRNCITQGHTSQADERPIVDEPVRIDPVISAISRLGLGIAGSRACPPVKNMLFEIVKIRAYGFFIVEYFITALTLEVDAKIESLEGAVQV